MTSTEGGGRVTSAPDAWLEVLSERLDARHSRMSTLRSYLDGSAPLPEGAEGCRDAYARFQKKARTNFGELIVEAVVERMSVSGFRVGDSQSDDDAARRIWRRSRLGTGSDVHADMLGLSVGYVMASGVAGRAVLTVERPEQVIVEADPTAPDAALAALKVYRARGEDFAFVHTPGVVTRYRRSAEEIRNGSTVQIFRVAGQWSQDGPTVATGLDFVPVWEFRNRQGRGEFETHTDLLDRINWGILQRLVITAMQAYRQRATKGDLPEQDEAGREINYGEVFRPGPGALWQLPEGVELWESATTDLTPILAACKDDITQLAAVTRTPMATLMPDSANQSAEGAAFAKEGLVFKAADRMGRCSWDAAVGGALAVERGERSVVEDVSTVWLPPERQSLAERADAATKATDFPWRYRMEKVWQVPAEEIDRMESARAQDALFESALGPAPAGPANVA